jgi:hypothetical protein
MTRETIDYARLGVEACQAFTEGPVAFADFVRTILSVAAPQHVLQTTSTGKLPEPGQIVHASVPNEALIERSMALVPADGAAGRGTVV